MKRCKSCGEERVLDSLGFCSKGICTLREEGYEMGFKEAWATWKGSDARQETLERCNAVARELAK